MNRAVIGRMGPNGIEKRPKIGPRNRIKQMAFTVAVGCAETLYRGASCELPMQYPGPLVLAAQRIVGKPDFSQPGGGAQIVHMPTRALADAAVMVAAGGHPARSEGAAHIEIPPLRQIDRPQPAHIDRQTPGAVQQQDVGAGTPLRPNPLQ
jgi:hypothetical protein